MRNVSKVLTFGGLVACIALTAALTLQAGAARAGIPVVEGPVSYEQLKQFIDSPQFKALQQDMEAANYNLQKFSDLQRARDYDAKLQASKSSVARPDSSQATAR